MATPAYLGPPTPAGGTLPSWLQRLVDRFGGKTPSSTPTADGERATRFADGLTSQYSRVRPYLHAPQGVAYGWRSRHPLAPPSTLLRGVSGTPDTGQRAALAAPDTPYMLAGQGGNLVSFTPNQARAWWAGWLAAPFDLLKVAPGALPGSLVLEPDQLLRVQAINNASTRGTAPLPAPPASVAGFALPVNQNTQLLTAANNYGSSFAPPALKP
jgi:hypothetical protein